MAEEWLAHWLRQSDDERREERLSEDDIAVFALVHLNLHGPERCAHFLRAWRPRSVSFVAGRIVARSLVDLDRIDDLNALAVAAGNNLYLALAAVIELRRICRNPPKEVTARTLRLVANPRIQLDLPSSPYDEQVELATICALVETGCAEPSIRQQTLLTVLDRYLPPTVPTSLHYGHWGGKAALLKPYCLHAVLAQKPLSLIDLGRVEWQEQHKKGLSVEGSQDFQNFKRQVGALLPWTQLWARQVAREVGGSELVSLLGEAESKSSEAGNRISYSDDVRTSGEVATVWLSMLIESGSEDAGSVEALQHWLRSLRRPLYTAALTEMVRLAARSAFLSAEAAPLAAEAYKLITSEKDHADQEVAACVDLARAIFATNASEARAYLDEAVRAARKVGDENLDRWNAILDLADRASSSDQAEPKLAYELARGAELTYAYVARDKHFPWHDTAVAITGLCPSSSLSVLSRWQDRGFGRPERLLPVVIRKLVEGGNLDGRSALALVGFRAEWDWPWLLEAALAGCSDQSEREIAASLLYRHMSLDGGATPWMTEAQSWTEIDRIARSHGVRLPEIEERIAFGNRKDDTSSAKERIAWSQRTEDTEVRSGWPEVFDGSDLTDPGAFSAAYRRYESLQQPRALGDFFEEAFSRTADGDAAKLIVAASSVQGLSLYAVRSLFEAIPEASRDLLSVKSAVKQTLKLALAREALEVVKSRYWSSFPFDDFARSCGLQRARSSPPYSDHWARCRSHSATGDCSRSSAFLCHRSLRKTLWTPSHSACRYSSSMSATAMGPGPRTFAHQPTRGLHSQATSGRD